MDKRSALDIINKFVKVLESQSIEVSKIVLYGSYSTGHQHDGSDIDIVVISEDFNGKSYWDRIDILSDAIYEIFEPIEAVALTEGEWSKGDLMITDYAKKGEVVFAA
jgi:uncharacterized protein